MRKPGSRTVPQEAFTNPPNRISQHSLMDFGKAGAVQKDHRKKIGFEPQKKCDPVFEPS